MFFLFVFIQIKSYSILLQTVTISYFHLVSADSFPVQVCVEAEMHFTLMRNESAVSSTINQFFFECAALIKKSLKYS